MPPESLIVTHALPSSDVVPTASVLESGCGSAVVVSALSAYGLSERETAIAQEIFMSQQHGADIEEMRVSFWRRGFWTQEMAGLGWEGLQRVRSYFKNIPMVSEFWDSRDYDELGIITNNTDPGSHYCLIIGFEGDNILLMDPALGKIIPMAKEDWMRSWHYRTGTTSENNVVENGWLMLLLLPPQELRNGQSVVMPDTV